MNVIVHVLTAGRREAVEKLLSIDDDDNDDVDYDDPKQRESCTDASDCEVIA